MMTRSDYPDLFANELPNLGRRRRTMPSTTEKMRRFMGADLARTRAGKKTRTGMSEAQLEDFASKKRKTNMGHSGDMPTMGKRQAMRSGTPPCTVCGKDHPKGHKGMYKGEE